MVLTIFTPTYNRKHTLRRLYDSLNQQTSKEFEWLVVDDGSTDGTEQLLDLWEKEQSEFKITYIKTQNGGKHRAINKGIQLANGELFFIVDSDDYITKDAVDFILTKSESILSDDTFAGIVGLKQIYSSKEIIDGEFCTGDYIDADYLERRKYNLLGDKAEVFKTKILKHFPFPEFEGEKFVSEGLVWNKIALAGYKLRWYNHVIYLCDYLAEGLTKNMYNILQNNPRGWAERIKVDKECEPKEYTFMNCYKFYEMFIDRFTKKEIADILQIEEKLLNEFERIYTTILVYIDKNIQGKKVAIYGMGTNGMRIMKYLEKGQYVSLYGIDKGQPPQKMQMKIYSPDEKLPQTDVVLVSSKKISDEDIIKIRNKIGMTKMINVWELDKRVW